MKRLVTSPIILAPFMKHLPLVLGITGAILGFSGTSEAQQEYGDALKAYVESDVKLCFACHDSAAGGGNKGRKFFTDTLKGVNWQGAANGGANGLKTALDKIKANDPDTDGDDVDDLTELAAGKNPSDPKDTPGGGASGTGGGGTGGGDSGSGTGAGGSGVSGTGGTPPAAGAAGDGGNDNASQATSAGCSYGSLNSSTPSGLALLTGAGLCAAAFARRRKRS
jgi:hypothetical protein